MKSKVARLASSLFMAVMAGCAIMTSAKPAQGAHLVEPTTDPPPIKDSYSSTGAAHRNQHQAHSSNQHKSTDNLRLLASLSELSIASSRRSNSAAASATTPSVEEKEEAAAQSQQQINQQHARSHHNDNQHQLLLQLQLEQQQQQQMPTTTGIRAQMIEQILAADLSERRPRRQLQSSDSISQLQVTESPLQERQPPLLLSSPTTDFIASSGSNNNDSRSRRYIVRRLIKRSGISDQKLAEMQMIRALKKQSERAASSRLTSASNLSQASLDLAST